jgi:hypothetical protein
VLYASDDPCRQQRIGFGDRAKVRAPARSDAGQSFFALGGQRKHLKTLILAKRIQGNPRFLSLILLARLCWILPDFAKLGLRLETAAPY